MWRAVVAAVLAPSMLLVPSIGTASPAVTIPAGAREVVPSPAVQARAGEGGAPKVREVRLHGLDRAVLAGAPAPHADSDHDGGSLSAQSTEPDMTPAVAADVTIVDPATLVAVSADSEFAVGTSIQVRVRERRGWTSWTTLHVDTDHGPDPGSPEAAGTRLGSAPLMTSAATRVQIRIDSPTGQVPAGTALTLVHSPAAASDALLGQVNQVTGGRMSANMRGRASEIPAAPLAQAMPQIITRAEWGADESWRSREPYYTDTVLAGFIHHTASTSTYTAEQAPAQVRAIYAYHTKSLGHSDIDYNFLVDRFGRLYEGRYGGMDRPVLGGHTAGFNERSFAIVALGNFETFAPAATEMAAMRDAIARVFAWKLGLHGGNPGQTVSLVSAGYIRATKYPKGTVATIPAVSTHQTVNFTACPGKILQAEVDAIRSLAIRYSNAAMSPLEPAVDTLMAGERASSTFVAQAQKAVQWTAQVTGPCTTSPVRTYSGSTAGPGPVDVTWDLRDGNGRAVLPGTYRIRLGGTTLDGAPVVPVQSVVTIVPKPGGPWGPCPAVSRVAGQSTAQTSVLWGRTTAGGSRVVVLTGPADAGAASLAAGIAAAPLARSLGAPLLLTPAATLDSEVAADIRRRAATEVIIVGSTSVVSNEVAASIAGLGVKVTRLAGSDDAGTAVAVAGRMPAARTAVVVAPAGSPAHALAGSALAATRRVPVLFATSAGVPRTTRSALAGLAGVTVVAPTALSDAEIRAGLGRVTWKRLTGATATSASIVVGRAHPAATSSVTLLADDYAKWATAPVAAASGRILLFTRGSALSAEVASFLAGRTGPRGASTPSAEAELHGEVLGAVSRILVPTGAVKLSLANATPEPVRRGRTVTVSAKVTAQYADGTWRAARDGVGFKVQFRAAGATAYRTVSSGRTSAGRATVRVKATKSGLYRIVVGSKKSASDYVRVKK